jgi:opacity protein-like surface antigen
MRETTLMKTRFNLCTVSVVALAAAASTLSTGKALAGDWNNGDGSLKDVRGRAAVAVPAPMPIPDSVGTGWYIRGDIGIGRRGSNDVSEEGMKFGHQGLSPSQTSSDTMIPWAGTSTHTSPFGSAPSWFNNDNKTIFNYGAGVGYHWTKNFRTDVTMDRRNSDKYRGRGTYAYEYQTTSTAVPTPAFTPYNTRVMGTVVDDTELKSGTMLLNGYYDIGTYRGFTPYVGGGLGMALLSVNRHTATQEQFCSYDPATPTPPVACPPANYQSGSHSAASGKTTMLAFAAMATAGVSYSLTQNTAIDMNYRYLFINGTDVTAGNSKLHLGDIGEHQLRTGLRWDIN